MTQSSFGGFNQVEGLFVAPSSTPLSEFQQNKKNSFTKIDQREII
nr:MAG TPA: hypothetical protein [Caudoviricetes sp.]